jgi:hypothetical protein
MAGEAESQALLKASESTARLMIEFLKFLQSIRRNSTQNRLYREQLETQKLKNNELKLNKPLSAGVVKHGDLLTEGRRLNYSVAAQDGITKNYVNSIAQKAKQYGIPVSFITENSSDNVKVAFRENEKNLFSQILNDVVKEQMRERPGELASFKVKPQNLSGFRALLNKNGLPADFLIDKNGGYHCVYGTSDKKAFDIVKSQYKNLLNEVDEKMSVTQSNEYRIIKDGANEISFADSELPTRESFTEILQSKFGYDQIKAELAANKFADTLPQEQRAKFIDNSPLNQCNAFERNIKLQGEDVRITPYEFYRANLKKDGTDVYFVMNDEGNAATLMPSAMSTKQMREMLSVRLGITDEKTIDALIEKAENIDEIYRRDITKLSQGDISIRRDGENGTFELKNGETTASYDLYNNRKAVDDIQKDFGVSKKEAKEIIDKARKQRTDSRADEIVQEQTEISQKQERSNSGEEREAELRIERKIGGTFTVTAEGATAEYEINHPAETTEKLKADWGVSDEDAAQIIGNARNQDAFDNELETVLGAEMMNAQMLEQQPELPPTPDIAPPEFEIDDNVPSVKL